MNDMLPSTDVRELHDDSLNTDDYYTRTISPKRKKIELSSNGVNKEMSPGRLCVSNSGENVNKEVSSQWLCVSNCEDGTNNLELCGHKVMKGEISSDVEDTLLAYLVSVKKKRRFRKSRPRITNKVNEADAAANCGEINKADIRVSTQSDEPCEQVNNLADSTKISHRCVRTKQQSGSFWRSENILIVLSEAARSFDNGRRISTWNDLTRRISARVGMPLSSIKVFYTLKRLKEKYLLLQNEAKMRKAYPSFERDDVKSIYLSCEKIWGEEKKRLIISGELCQKKKCVNRKVAERNLRRSRDNPPIHGVTKGFAMAQKEIHKSNRVAWNTQKEIIALTEIAKSVRVGQEYGKHKSFQWTELASVIGESLHLRYLDGQKMYNKARAMKYRYFRMEHELRTGAMEPFKNDDEKLIYSLCREIWGNNGQAMKQQIKIAAEMKSSELVNGSIEHVPIYSDNAEARCFSAETLHTGLTEKAVLLSARGERMTMISDDAEVRCLSSEVTHATLTENSVLRKVSGKHMAVISESGEGSQETMQTRLTRDVESSKRESRRNHLFGNFQNAAGRSCAEETIHKCLSEFVENAEPQNSLTGVHMPVKATSSNSGLKENMISVFLDAHNLAKESSSCSDTAKHHTEHTNILQYVSAQDAGNRGVVEEVENQFDKMLKEMEFVCSSTVKTVFKELTKSYDSVDTSSGIAFNDKQTPCSFLPISRYSFWQTTQPRRRSQKMKMNQTTMKVQLVLDQFMLQLEKFEGEIKKL